MRCGLFFTKFCGSGCAWLDNWLVISFLLASYLNLGLVSEGALLVEESYQYDKGSIIFNISIGFWLFSLRYFLHCWGKLCLF